MLKSTALIENTSTVLKSAISEIIQSCEHKYCTLIRTERAFASRSHVKLSKFSHFMRPSGIGFLQEQNCLSNSS